MSHAVKRYCVPVGARAPHRMQVTLAAGGLIPDTSAVVGITLAGRDIRTNAEIIWELSIAIQSSLSVTAERLYTDADTAAPRTIRFVAWTTITGADNPIHCGVFDLVIEAP